MNFKLSFLISSFILTVFSNSIFAEPPNIALLKQELIAYHDSGLYEKEIEHVTNQARAYINQEIKINNQRKNKQKLALILDIDETSLSNYKHIIERDFMSDLAGIHQDILLSDASAIQPTLDLYNDAIKQGVSVFFITGRDSSELEATKTNLLKAGYKDWSEVMVRSQKYKGEPAISYKTQMRDLIAKQGYTIIASIGDQYSDLIGGYAAKEFKLPNPYYFLP